MGKGKQKNSKRLRPQEYADDLEDGVIERETPTEKAERAYQTQQSFAEANRKLRDMGLSPSYQPPRLKPEDAGIYREGHVVVCPNTSKLGDSPTATGTIVAIVAGEVHVLDGHGFMHKVPISKIYLAQ